MGEDHDYGRGDDRFMRGAPDKKVPKSKQGGCWFLSLMLMPVAAVTAVAIVVKPFFRR